jgi:rRNA-processing protein FCF1
LSARNDNLIDLINRIRQHSNSPIVFVTQTVTDELDHLMKFSDNPEVRARAWLFKVQCLETDSVSQICHQPAAEHLSIKNMRLVNNDENIVNCARYRLENDTTYVTIYSNDKFMLLRAKHHDINFQEPVMWIDRSYIRSDEHEGYD